MIEIIFDTETTGLNHTQGDRVLEVAFIEIVDKKKTGRILHHYFNPEKKITEESTNIHGLTNEFLSDKPKFSEIADELWTFIEGADALVAHNSAFDIKFLNNEFHLVNKLKKDSLYPKLENKFKIIDTLIMARENFPGQRNNLDSLCKRFNIDISKRTIHSALLDTELLLEVYIAMSIKQTDMNLSPVRRAQINKSKGSKSNLSAKSGVVIYADESEVQVHEAFMESIKKAS